MARRIWVITKKEEVGQSDRDDAFEHNCPEIVNGIPPVLQNTITENDLPCAFEEPEAPLPVPPRNLAAELDELKAKLITLERI